MRLMPEATKLKLPYELERPVHLEPTREPRIVSWTKVNSTTIKGITYFARSSARHFGSFTPWKDFYFPDANPFMARFNNNNVYEVESYLFLA